MSNISIRTHEELAKTRQDFENDPKLASLCSSLDISIKLPEFDEEISEAEQKRQTNLLAHTTCENVTALLSAISSLGQLLSFKWRNVEFFRPKAFWDALSAAAATLKTLDLDFHTHEIQHLGGEGTNPVPNPFPVLDALILRMSGEHGGDAKVFDEMLKKTTTLRSLKLYLPTCDLESCRISGLSYDWNFPSLEELLIEVWVDEDFAATDFLARHKEIQILYFALDSYDLSAIDILAPMVNLRHLYLDSHYSATKPSTTGSVIRCGKLQYLSLDNPEDASLFPGWENHLKSLELRNRWWVHEEREWADSDEEDGISHAKDARIHDAMKTLFGKLESIEELALEFHSDEIYMTDDDHKTYHPEPLGELALTMVLDSFPKNCEIRALRMTDDAASALSQDFMDKFPEATPLSLEYIRWGARSEEFGIVKLYKIERSVADQSVRAVEFSEDNAKKYESLGGKSPLRRPLRIGEAVEWNEESVLDHLTVRPSLGNATELPLR